MDREEKLDKRWRALQWLIGGFIRRRFNMHAEPCDAEGPCLIISNHVTTWDPMLLAMSFRSRNIHFVASEHIFRLGLVSKLLCALVEPIPRRKASTGTDTVMMSLRKLKAGGRVCIFAEGDATWDGVSAKVFPATGKLARTSGVTLVTYRLEGGYLSLPRWSHKTRRGRMRGHAVNVYTPQQLRAMTPSEIDDAINRDIYEDAWQRQRDEGVEYGGGKLAEHIETALFICPRCGRVGGLQSWGDKVTCSCGMELAYTPLGFFDPPEPFETVRQWDLWQYDKLRRGDFPHGESLFADDGLTLREVLPGHRDNKLGTGTLRQFADRLEIAGRSFGLRDIGSMAMLKASVLLFTVDQQYFEVRAAAPCCLRKYLAAWENARSAT